MKPFLKWVGGKSRLASTLMTMLPSDVDRRRHVELFAGSAALFFAREPKSALLADNNKDLMITYMSVRSEVFDVLRHLKTLESEHSVDAYRQARDEFNANRRRSRPAARQAALFIYLNKTCYNGLWRVNARGEFNVPAGRYANPRILNHDALTRATCALRNVELEVGDYTWSAGYVDNDDFVYLDPPYKPASRTSNFTAYTSDGFDDDDRRNLHNLFVSLDAQGAKVMLSESDTRFTRDLYARYHIDTVTANRSVNRDKTKRGPVNELVIRNY